MTDKLSVTHIQGDEFEISLTRDGIRYVAYGTYTPDGLGGLDHAPNQSDIDIIGSEIDRYSDADWARAIKTAKEKS